MALDLQYDFDIVSMRVWEAVLGLVRWMISFEEMVLKSWGRGNERTECLTERRIRRLIV